MSFHKQCPAALDDNSFHKRSSSEKTHFILQNAIFQSFMVPDIWMSAHGSSVFIFSNSNASDVVFIACFFTGWKSN